MNKILIVVGLILVAVVFFVLGIRIMMPNNDTVETQATETTTTQPESGETTVADEPEATEDTGPWFSVNLDPVTMNTFTYSLNEPVEADLPNCKDSLFPTESPYLVDFGDGETAPLTARNTGYAIEGGYCSLFWEASHEYKAEGTYEVKLIKEGTTISTKQAVLGSDSR